MMGKIVFFVAVFFLANDLLYSNYKFLQQRNSGVSAVINVIVSTLAFGYIVYLAARQVF